MTIFSCMTTKAAPCRVLYAAEGCAEVRISRRKILVDGYAAPPIRNNPMIVKTTEMATATVGGALAI